MLGALFLLSLLHFQSAFSQLVPGTQQNNAPRFLNSTMVFFVNESQPIGYEVAIVAAYDSDDLMLTFSIIGDVANSILELQQRDNQSVYVKLKQKVDRESIDEYNFAMRVEDSARNFHDKYASLYVIDANDNPPVFQVLPYKAEIKEDAALGSFVFKLTATDADQGSAAVPYYAITTPQFLFAVVAITGNVTLNGTLDYEQEKFYQLEVMSYDILGLNSTTDLVINVLDVQDTAPYFTNLPYMQNVFENLTAGSSVLKVTAMDGDRGVPNPVNYSFHSGNHDFFRIDPTSGLITVGPQGLDREDPAVVELFGVWEFVVLAQEVTNSPKGPTTATAHVTIRVLDVNDQTPSFSNVTYTGHVLENTQQTIPISMDNDVFVFDYDEADNGRFAVTLEKDGKPFTVFEVFPNPILNEANLLIRVKNSSALDFEKVQNVTFEAVAKETNTPERRENRTTITVVLLDVNDNWPEFAEASYTAEIDENSPRDTLVTTITATDEDSGSYGSVSYMLRGASAQLFRVDSAGNLYVNVSASLGLLDREKQDTHYLNYEAVDGGNLRSSVPLIVTLRDRNDNAPRLGRAEYEGYVTENDSQLERPLVVEGTDEDLGPDNNNISFSIIAGDPLNNFTIDPLSGQVSLASGPLDYESLPSGSLGIYELTVMAQDRGTPALNSTALVVINVEDRNDEAPGFTQGLYNATIPENSTGGTNVTQVLATDLDRTSPNNEMIYRIESGGLDKFRIDASTGLVSVEVGANLDRDVYPQAYNLRVLAIDRGTPPNTGTTTVQVTISDINNKAPVFSPPQQSKVVPEDLAPGSPVLTYNATDLDLGALLEYRLLDDQVYGEYENKTEVANKTYLAGLFSIHPLNGTVYVASALDRETAELVRLTIFVEDMNAQEPPLQTATALLTITLSDVNDNPPEFVPSDSYKAVVPESSTVGFEVKKVEAVDRDKNPSAITYYLVGDPTNPYDGRFEITEANRATGIITLKQAVDYESHQQVLLTVSAWDTGVPPSSSNATVLVAIQDINDNAPVWINFTQTLTVAENITTGTVVTTISASDVDSGEFGQVMYFLISGGNGDFTLNNITGALTTTGGLNRELRASYSLQIEARDNNNAPESGRRATTGYMSVTVGDVNDNTPVLEEEYYFRQTQENIGASADILTVHATDLDIGNNARITYSIDGSQGNGSHLFRINPTSGLISTSIALTGYIGHFYLVAVATDGGWPALFNTTLVHVFVEDVNDHDPKITSPPANCTIYIYEHAPLGYPVVQVVAYDLDAGDNGRVQYEFVTSASSRPDYMFFHIGTTSGNITVAADIDREVQEVYYLAVRAYDQGDPQRDDISTIVVRAIDIDDNPPIFDRALYPPPYPVSVTEETQGVEFVANLALATDSDFGNNSLICYYIVGGDEPYMDPFHMNKTTGDLWLGSGLDRETVNTVALIVQASTDCVSDFFDREENLGREWNESDTSTLLVHALVYDINDNAPYFRRKWFTDGVTKDTQFGEEVIDVSEYSVDADIGNNSLLTYVIDGPFRFSHQLQGQFEDDPFVIGRYDGIIRTNVYFQDDHEGYIEFTIRVSDPNPLHFDNANVSVYLLTIDQRVKVVIRGEPEEVNEFKDEFAEFLSSVTGVIVNVDQILTHKDKNGQPDPRKTDMFIHGIDPKTGEVLDADELIYLIDSNYDALAEIFKIYNVIEVVPAVEDTGGSSVDQTVLFSMVAIATVLILIILVVIGAFLVCRKKYKRKLKAATAVAYGASDGLNTVNTPNTNLHSFEGSNPIWLEKYDQGWPRESEDTDSKNSLDQNDVVPTFNNEFDEHERTMEMYNDELDQYQRNMAAHAGMEGDAVLRAALQERHRPNNMDNSSPAGLISAQDTPNSVYSEGRRGSQTGTPHSAAGSVSKHHNGLLNGGASVRSLRAVRGDQSYSHNNPNGAHSNHMDITAPLSGDTLVIAPGGAYNNPTYETEATQI